MITEFHAEPDLSRGDGAFALAAFAGAGGIFFAGTLHLAGNPIAAITSLAIGGVFAVLCVVVGSILCFRRVPALTIVVDDESLRLLHEGRHLGEIPFANVDKIIPARADPPDPIRPDDTAPFGIHIVLKRPDDPETDRPAPKSTPRRITIVGGWDRPWLAMVDLFRKHENRYLAAHGLLREPADDENPFRFE